MAERTPTAVSRSGRIALLLSLCALVALAGCAVSQVAKGRPGQDLSAIVPGAPRAKVESVVGAAKKIMSEFGGKVPKTIEELEETVARRSPSGGDP